MQNTYIQDAYRYTHLTITRNYDPKNFNDFVSALFEQKTACNREITISNRLNVVHTMENFILVDAEHRCPVCNLKIPRGVRIGQDMGIL